MLLPPNSPHPPPLPPTPHTSLQVKEGSLNERGKEKGLVEGRAAANPTLPEGYMATGEKREFVESLQKQGRSAVGQHLMSPECIPQLPPHKQGIHGLFSIYKFLDLKIGFPTQGQQGTWRLGKGVFSSSFL